MMANSLGRSDGAGPASSPLEQLSREELALLITRYQELLIDVAQLPEERQRLETDLQRTRAELFGRWLRERTGSG